jgi:opacity protein-like surface antigen
MKFFRILLVLLFPIVATAQNWEMGSDFYLSQPVGGMTRTMSSAFGITLDAAYKFKMPFSLGAEIGLSNYGMQTTRQSYQFADGSITETNVNVSNGLYNFMLTGKYFLRNNKKISPYVSGKLGWALFSTTLTIEDPEDEFSCHPIESDILSRDNTYTANVGGGARIDFSSIFKRMDSERFYFDLSVHSTQGGTVRYMNANTSHANHGPADDEVTAKFINTQTQIVHEHHVGNLYTSVLNMVEYRFGVMLRPGW